MVDVSKRNASDFKPLLERYGDLLKKIEIDTKTILLSEGEYARRLYFIEKGCLRLWFNNRGEDVTVQFFFEGDRVASAESFFGNQPSFFNLETLEPSVLYYMTKKNFETILENDPDVSKGLLQVLTQRFMYYAQLHLSFIKDTPTDRYIELLKTQPRIVQRVPQHYIASYLGITPVSLSRIRTRISSVRNNKIATP